MQEQNIFCHFPQLCKSSIYIPSYAILKHRSSETATRKEAGGGYVFRRLADAT